MHELGWQTFVLQRRINNRPTVRVARTVRNAAVFAAGTTLSCGGDGALRLDESFARVDTYAEPTWRANGRLVSRYRRSASVQVEISPWSDADTQLLLRPRASNPQRWSSHRLRRYFLLAHQCADDLAQLLFDTTAAGQPDPIRQRRLANA